MRYLLKTLPPNYRYIGDFIDVIPEEQRTVDYVTSKIKEKNLNRNQNEKKNVSTFNAKLTCNVLFVEDPDISKRTVHTQGPIMNKNIETKKETNRHQ